MKLSLATVLGGIAIAQASIYDHWSAPGPKDARGPCPMLNTLANHDILPHDGKNIDEDTMIDALQSALNMDVDFIKYLYSFAIQTNPDADAKTVNLDHLTTHNILEHDASFSRQDTFFGPADVFNATVFEETLSFWSETMTLEEIAFSRAARFHTSNRTNPEYTMPERGRIFSLGEAVALIMIFGDRDALTSNRELVVNFFENEKLPLELGWKRPEKLVDERTQNRIMNMMSELTPDIDEGKKWKPEEKRDVWRH